MGKFTTDYIDINENGIDLLRSRFPFMHIGYEQINGIVLKDGYLLKNRLIILVLGFFCISLCTKLIMSVLPNEAFGTYSLHIYNFRSMQFIFFFPLLLLLFGVYCIFQSFKKSKLLVIKVDAHTYNIRIPEIQKQNNLDEMIQFLNKKVHLEIVKKKNEY